MPKSPPLATTAKTMQAQTTMLSRWSSRIYSATPRQLRPAVRALYAAVEPRLSAALSAASPAAVARLPRVARRIVGRALVSTGVLPARPRRSSASGGGARLVVVAEASSSSHGEQHPTPQQHETETTVDAAMDRVLRLFSSHDLAGLVAYVPEDVIVRTAMSKGAARASSTQQQKAPAALTLDDCVDTMLRTAPPSAHFLDSFAVRHLVLAAPRRLQPLSAVRVGAERYVARVAVSSASGEEAVLTFTLQRREPAAPRPGCPSGRASWAFVRVEGEAAPFVSAAAGLGSDAADASSLPLLLASPSPEFPPEAVVAAQLAALQRRDVEAAFAFASPRGRATAGTRRGFGAALAADARFAPLLAHAGAASLRRCHSQARTYVEVVQVDGADTGPRLYCWVLTLQGGDTAPQWRDCWMVDCVTPIHDQRLLQALLPDVPQA